MFSTATSNIFVFIIVISKDDVEISFHNNPKKVKTIYEIKTAQPQNYLVYTNQSQFLLLTFHKKDRAK